MNRFLIALLALLIAFVPAFALADESSEDAGAPGQTPAPAGFGMDIPIDVPIEEEAAGGDDVFGFDGYSSSVSLEYESLTNKTFGLVMDRPAAWIQIPGRHTLCFQDGASTQKTPARMALSRKTVTKELTDSRITSELIAFLKTIAAQYDSFEVGDLSKDTAFIGQMGYSTFYSAQKDGNSVRGYVIVAAISKYVYAFHFSTAENEFNAYTSVMVHIRESMQVKID